ncbi:MAG: 50S ribosomal protein L25/general stress protein Ctc [Micropruina sp.]|nr:50S ribosomal protein L25/general stress protein Ctc [Micropruina sp.]
MAEVKLSAVARTEFGKGAARRTRRAGLVPAVLYGHGTDPIHVALPAHETQLALRAANALLAISIDGAAPQLALPKQVQKDPVRGTLEHIDLVVVNKGERVTVEIALVIVNDDRPDRIVVMDQQTIAIEVAATNIPAQIEIDIAGLNPGDAVYARDLVLPEGAVFPGEPGDLMLSIAASKSQEDLDAELDAASGVTDSSAVTEAAAVEA